MNKYSTFFTNSEDTIKVDLADKQWVEIKALMSIGDWERYNSSMVSLQSTGGSGNREQRRGGFRSKNTNDDTVGKLSAGWMELLRINIVSWSFDGVNLNKDNISKLKPEWTDVIIDAIDEANPRSPLAATSSIQDRD